MRNRSPPSLGRRKIILGNLKIPIDLIPTMRYILLVLSDKGPLSRSDPSSGQSESWPDRGAPERSMAWWLVERWEALRLALGARSRLAARGGYVNPASEGASQASWRLPPIHPLAQVARGT